MLRSRPRSNAVTEFTRRDVNLEGAYARIGMSEEVGPKGSGYTPRLQSQRGGTEDPSRTSTKLAF